MHSHARQIYYTCSHAKRTSHTAHNCTYAPTHTTHLRAHSYPAYTAELLHRTAHTLGATHRHTTRTSLAVTPRAKSPRWPGTPRGVRPDGGPGERASEPSGPRPPLRAVWRRSRPAAHAPRPQPRARPAPRRPGDPRPPLARTCGFVRRCAPAAAAEPRTGGWLWGRGAPPAEPGSRPWLPSPGCPSPCGATTGLGWTRGGPGAPDAELACAAVGELRRWVVKPFRPEGKPVSVLGLVQVSLGPRFFRFGGAGPPSGRGPCRPSMASAMGYLERDTRLSTPRPT